MQMKKTSRLVKAARWVGRVLEVRLPMGIISGIRTH
jgi:hypothetical protein